MSQYPVINYHFQVEWGGARIGFMEVSGLNIEAEAIVFREGSSPEDNFKKLPGLIKYDDIVLKRTIQKGDNDFFQWMNTKSAGVVERRDVTVSLLDDQHQPVVQWKIRNAFPVHYYGPVLNASHSSVATETLVLTHEGITVQTN
ncbi:MAG: phage tail protein [Chitinophagaceae bacterium]|nr:phage tail protein [Chitinophagaceae bacterium]